jgi:hypothetical protein
MPRTKFFLFFSLTALLFAAISCNSQKEQEEKPLVYEGMSADELRSNLGEPASIDSSGKVFDTRYKKKMVVEKWKYEKRTVLLINDTVKDSNLN